MPKFDTPEPILATVELPGGEVRISASDRTDTVVEVRPRDESEDVDVETARDTVVEYAQGRLLVKAPRTKGRWWRLEWGAGAVEVTIDLPTGSRVDVTAALAKVRCQGRLGETKIKTSTGDTRLEETGRLKLKTAGDIMVERSVGHADVSTANGDIWIREIDGTAVIKTANGDITLGEVTGDVRLSTASGDLTVDRALASVSVKTPSGEIRIGEVVRGVAVLESAAGEVEIGISEGTAAWLDVHTRYGTVRNELAGGGAPTPAEEAVEVRARTGAGDIVIRRA